VDCAVNHPSSKKYYNPKKCEDCQIKVPHFGLLIEGPTHAISKGKARWCGLCAKAHEGAIDVGRRKCETCQMKQPSFGFAADGKARWCSACSKEHEGAKDVLNSREYKHVRGATKDKDRVAETHARLTAQITAQKEQLEVAAKAVDWLEAKLQIYEACQGALPFAAADFRARAVLFLDDLRRCACNASQ
jgi:hypothetical protein